MQAGLAPSSQEFTLSPDRALVSANRPLTCSGDCGCTWNQNQDELAAVYDRITQRLRGARSLCCLCLAFCTRDLASVSWGLQMSRRHLQRMSGPRLKELRQSTTLREVHLQLPATYFTKFERCEITVISALLPTR